MNVIPAPAHPPKLQVNFNIRNDFSELTVLPHLFADVAFICNREIVTYAPERFIDINQERTIYKPPRPSAACLQSIEPPQHQEATQNTLCKDPVSAILEGPNARTSVPLQEV